MSVDHQDGLLELEFRRGGRGRSVLSALRQRFPLRMTVPFYLDAADPGMAFVYVQNPTGGVFAGDRLVTQVSAREGTRVHVTTQSATKLYRMDGGEAVQRLRFDLGPEAFVEHIPDPLIPQAGSRFRQRLLVELAPGARFVGAEVVAPGRRAHGERFAYDLLELRTVARAGACEQMVDLLRLEPGRGDPLRAGVLGGSEYLVTVLALALEHDAQALARGMDEALARVPVPLGAAGELPNEAGAMARALVGGPLEARRALLAAWGAARLELGGLPLPRVRK